MADSPINSERSAPPVSDQPTSPTDGPIVHSCGPRDARVLDATQMLERLQNRNPLPERKQALRELSQGTTGDARVDASLFINRLELDSDPQMQSAAAVLLARAPVPALERFDKLTSRLHSRQREAPEPSAAVRRVIARTAFALIDVPFARRSSAVLDLFRQHATDAEADKFEAANAVLSDRSIATGRRIDLIRTLSESPLPSSRAVAAKLVGVMADLPPTERTVFLAALLADGAYPPPQPTGRNKSVNATPLVAFAAIEATATTQYLDVEQKLGLLQHDIAMIRPGVGVSRAQAALALAAGSDTDTVTRRLNQNRSRDPEYKRFTNEWIAKLHGLSDETKAILRDELNRPPSRPAR